MPPEFYSAIARYSAPDWAGLVGLAVTLIGFTVTVWNVRRSKRAAEQAEQAANRARDLVRQANTVVDFSAAVTIVDEIRRLQRTGTWALLPDRYSSLKRLLVEIRSANPTMSDKQKTMIQAAIAQFTSLEQKIEEVIANPETKIQVPRLNKIVSLQLDSLSEVFAEVKAQLAEDRG